MRLGTIRKCIEIGIPGVGLIRCGMADLAAYGHVVSGLLDQIGHVRPARILDLIKAFDLVVVGIKPGKHHVTAGHAIAHRYMCVVEPDGLRSQTVHPGARPPELASVDADRVTTHVVNSDNKQIRRVGLRVAARGNQ